MNGAFPVALVISIVVVAAYSAVFSSTGLFDERFLLSWAQDSSFGELARGVAHWGGFSTLDFWGPVAALLFKAESLSGPESLLPRIISILFHGASSVLALFVLHSIVQSGRSGEEQNKSFSRQWFAPGAALLFALSPLHLDCVGWLGGQPQLVAGFFVMLSLFFYMRVRGRGIIDWRFLAASGVCYLVALATSAYAWVGAIFVLVYEIWNWSSLRRDSKDLTQTMIPALLFCVLAMMVLAATGAGFKLLLMTPEINLESTYKLLELVFLPTRPSLFPLLLPFFALSFWAAYRNAEYRHLLLFALCAFVALWIPASGYPFNAQELDGTRFLYLAVLPLSLLIVLLFASVQYVSSAVPLLKFLGLLFVFGVTAAYALSDWPTLSTWADSSRIVEIIGRSLSEDWTKHESFLVVGIPDETVRARSFRPGALALVNRRRNLISATQFSSPRLDEALLSGKYSDRMYQWHEPTKQLIRQHFVLIPRSGASKRLQGLPQLTCEAAKTSNQEAAADKYLPPYYNFPDLPDLGLYTLPKGTDRIVLNFDASNIGGAKGVIIEVSQPNQRFTNPNGNRLSSHGYQTHQFRQVKGVVEMSTGPLPGKGVYSIRAIAVDSQGAFISKFSDAISIQVR